MAQYPYLSHQDWLQWQSNPAYLGVNKQENLILDYNRSWISNEINSNIGLLQYERALLNSKNNNIGGVGLSILNNRVNYKELFNRFQASMGASYAMKLKKQVYLNFGLQGTYFADRVDNTGLITGSQYLPGWGFDPNSSNNEPLLNQNTQYFGISTGFFVYQESSFALADNYMGVSFKNFNQPVNSFDYEISRLPMQFNAMGGMRLTSGLRTKLLGELWYSSSGNGNLTLGAIYQINNLINQRNSEENIHLRLISRYSTNNKLFIGGQMLYNGFAIGVTYDVPINHTQERTYDSGFEVMLVLHRKARPFRGKRNRTKKDRKQSSKKTLIMQEPLLKANTSEQVIIPVEQTENADTIISVDQNTGNASVGDLIDDKPLEREVYFDFASNEITNASDELLMQFVANFFINKKTIIVVTGHTDDVGSIAYNKKLSIQRAESVKQKLLSYGVSEDKIQVNGMGEDQPIAPNDSNENRSKNRRVEITFY